jgi:hypothetical protein
MGTNALNKLVEVLLKHPRVLSLCGISLHLYTLAKSRSAVNDERSNDPRFASDFVIPQIPMQTRYLFGVLMATFRIG